VTDNGFTYISGAHTYITKSLQYLPASD